MCSCDITTASHNELYNHYCRSHIGERPGISITMCWENAEIIVLDCCHILSDPPRFGSIGEPFVVGRCFGSGVGEATLVRKETSAFLP